MMSKSSFSRAGSEVTSLLPQNLTAAQWLDEFVPDDTAPNKQVLAEGIYASLTRQADEAPLYLRALAGIGALIAGFLFFLLLYFFGVLDWGNRSLLVNGAVFMGLAALLYRVTMSTGASKGAGIRHMRQDFMLQASLTLLQIGKIVFVFGAVALLRDLFDWTGSWAVTFILLVIGAFSYLAFPSGLERFLAAGSVLFSLWITLLISELHETQTILYHLVLIGHFALIAAFLYKPAWRYGLSGLFDASLISLCFGIGFVAMEADLGQLSLAMLPIGPKMSLSVQGLLAFVLILLVLWLANGPAHRRSPALWAAIAGIGALALFSDAGILLALGVLILGYALHRSHLIALGVLFGVFFIARYYYHLELSLAQKSLTLMLSGGSLLVGAGVIHWFGWNRPEAETLAPHQTREV